MADMRIDDATLDLDVTGIENLPVSDAGAAKRMTVGQIKDFVLTAIASLSSGSVGDESLFFHSKSGTNYKANLSEVAAKVVDKAFDSASVNTPAASKFLIEDANGTKTISITNLCNYIKDNVALIDITSLTNAGTLGDGDYTILSQGGTNVKATLSSVANYIEGKLGSWINSLSDVGTISGTDKLIVSVNGTSRSVSVSSLMSSVQGGFVTGPSTTTENNVPQWDSTTKQLKNGLAVRTSVRAVGTADNSSIATEAAVAAAVGAIDTGVGIDGTTPTTGNIPVWAGATKIASGKTVTTEVRNSILSSDAAIATEKAVRTAIDTMGSTKVNVVSGKGLSTEDYTTAEKTKLSGISTGADVSTITGVQVDGTDLVVSNKKVNVVLTGKVDKVTGKGLSTEDYTTAEKTKLSGIATGADVSTITTVKVNGTALVPVEKTVNVDISGKVDKVSGKGLSTNDYTTAEKTKLSGIATGADVSTITSITVNGTSVSPVNKVVNIDISGKVDKVTGKGLSTNDYTNAEMSKLSGIATGAQVNVIESVSVDGVALVPSGKSVNINLTGKVDKVNGKGLSTNDYTTAEKTKLNGIATGADVSTITGVQVDGTDLVVTNKKVNVVLSGKVDKVSGKGLSTEDYTTAEKTKLSGIATGADVSTITGVQVDGTDLVVSNKKVNVVLSGKVDKVSGKGLSTNDYTTVEKTKLAGVEAGAQENVQADWNQTNTLADDFIKNKPTIPTMPSVPIQAWVAGKTYAVGDYCVQGGFLQRCIHAGSTQIFNANDWEYIPAYPTTNMQSVFLRGDGTWATPSSSSSGVIAEWEANKTYAIGDYCHYNGYVRRCIYAGSASTFNPSSWENFPAYPSALQTEKYLRGDGTWVSLPQMGGATTASAGTSGLVPTPSASDSAKFLKGNGVWTAIPTMTGAMGSAAGSSGLVPAPESTDGTKFLKGDGTWGTPSGMDAMTGATSVLPGSAGTVPAPTAGDDSKFLCGDGTWKSVQGSGGGDVYGPSSTTENMIPQWDSTTKRLKNGVSLNTSVGVTPSNAAVLSEKAVADTFVRGSGLKIEVVSSVPASPVANTIYFVTEAS